MPKKVAAWECEFGCGKYLKTKKSIFKHEKTCFYNPARKACQSCGAKETDWEVDVIGEHSVWYCPIFDFDFSGNPGQLKFDCESWRRNES
ncbi:MAG: hypothetical protein GY757_19145 [bacterium]|nr:hypothetical protein [bacterium]